MVAYLIANGNIDPTLLHKKTNGDFHLMREKRRRRRILSLFNIFYLK
jgi:hypothetical protein